MTAELTAENRSKLAELTAENKSQLAVQKQEVTLVLTTNFKGEKASLCAEHASTLADMQADHDLKQHQLSRSMAMVKKELTTTMGELALSEQMVLPPHMLVVVASLHAAIFCAQTCLRNVAVI